VGVEIPEPQADIIVEDYGCDYSLPSLATADQILLVCGGAVWHRDDAKPKDFLLQEYRSRLHLIANLCDRNSAIYFARKFSLPVYRYPYDPDIFRINRGKEDFVRWLSIEKGGNHLFLRFRNLFFRLLRR
jgi:serine/threonine-protein kinase